MKEEKNKTNRPLSEFQRYVRGEMTKRQENAFQRKLQRDPFASEAADGYSEISADEAEGDLEQLGKRFKKRVTGRRRIIYYRIAASIAVLMIISSVYLFIDRNKPGGEITKDAKAPQKMEAIDTQKSFEPERQVTGIIAESQEVTAEKEKSDAVSIPVVAEPVSQETLAFAEKQDTSVIVAAGQIAMAEKDDSAVIIAADQVAEPAAPVSDAILADYRAETKNARAAGAEAAKAAVTEAVNTPPLPVIGKTNYDNYLKEQIKRPENLAAGDSAIIVISFTVKITGSIEGINVISSPGDEFSNEAKRLVTEGPAWNPAVRNGEKIDEIVRLRINFEIDNHSMARKLKELSFLLFLIISFEDKIISQPVDSTSFKLNSRLSFYSYENSGEMLLHVPQNMIYNKIEASLNSAGKELAVWEGIPRNKIVRIKLAFNKETSTNIIDAVIRIYGTPAIYSASARLSILQYKSNEVKTDRLTGGLIVNRRQFFPFGFYTYSPVHPALPEEEVVKGFNMISPYQRILPETFKARKAYMDRCAQLGMKVHYNLLSVSGGGGVSSNIEGLSEDRKRELLRKEIEAFRDHPALLAWYIADEPNGYRIEPDSLLKIYNLVRELDPWHPVTIVFMAPFMSSRQYADALDIVMADPYPVPDSPISMVGDAAGKLAAEFAGRKPVWIVPQAFGGGEWWEREPTLQELRSMTYQSIVKGARGIQYFVRQGLNLFPKSTSSWAECGRMASEIAEMTPWLLSDEETVAVRSGNQNIIVSSALHDGQLMIVAVNKTNSPQRVDFSVALPFSGKVKVLFENRSVNQSGGYFSDHLSAFGSQVYLINLKKEIGTLKPWTKNLIKDPGFEDVSSTGVPASCYARGGGDRGATYFLDSREHFEGKHSIRLVTPTENKSIKLRFFPITGRNGGSYFISVWAKADPEQGLKNGTENKKQYFEIALGDYAITRFELTGEWKEYVTNVTIPYYNDQPPRTNVILQMPSSGVAWFDMLQAVESVDIYRSINPELKIFWDY